MCVCVCARREKSSTEKGSYSIRVYIIILCIFHYFSVFFALVRYINIQYSKTTFDDEEGCGRRQRPRPVIGGENLILSLAKRLRGDTHAGPSGGDAVET